MKASNGHALSVKYIPAITAADTLTHIIPTANHTFIYPTHIFAIATAPTTGQLIETARISGQ